MIGNIKKAFKNKNMGIYNTIIHIYVCTFEHFNLISSLNKTAWKEYAKLLHNSAKMGVQWLPQQPNPLRPFVAPLFFTVQQLLANVSVSVTAAAWKPKNKPKTHATAYHQHSGIIINIIILAISVPFRSNATWKHRMSCDVFWALAGILM